MDLFLPKMRFLAYVRERAYISRRQKVRTEH